MFSIHCSHCAVVVIAKLGVKISSDVICFCLDTTALSIIAFVYWNRAQEIALYTATGRHASQETPLQYIYKRVQSNCIFPDLNWFYHSKHVSAVVLNFFGFFVAGTIPTLTFLFPLPPLRSIRKLYQKIPEWRAIHTRQISFQDFNQLLQHWSMLEALSAPSVCTSVERWLK